MSRPELEKRLEVIGVGAGWTGGMIRHQAASAIIGSLAPDSNGRVQWESFVNGSPTLLPPELVLPDGTLNAAAAASLLGTISGSPAGATRAELASHVQSSLATKPLISAIAGFIADPAARIVLDLAGLSPDNGVLSPQALEALIEDINAQKAKLAS